MRCVWLMLLVGCGTPSEEEPFVCDTEVYICDTAAWWLRNQIGTQDRSEGVYIDQVALPGCVDDRWTYTAVTKGLTNGTNLANAWVSVEMGGYSEEQPLLVSSSDAAGDYLHTSLQAGVASDSVISGDSTALICDFHDVNPMMNYALRVYDGDGNLADCAVFTNRQQQQVAIDELFDNPTEEIPISRRQELNRSNCAVWAIAE